MWETVGREKNPESIKQKGEREENKNCTAFE